jgi:hypothetical protein
MKHVYLSAEDAIKINQLISSINAISLSGFSSKLMAELSKQSPKAIFEVEAIVGQILPKNQRSNDWFWFSGKAAFKIDLADAPLLMFNRNGYIREEAFKNLQQLPSSPFFVAALVYRMNDWVAPVRLAAEECAKRILPTVPANIVVRALPFLLGRIDSWTRWNEIPNIVLSTLTRVDCEKELAFLLARPNDIRASAVRTALRLGLLDNHILDLAQTAKRPEHRAVILKSLINSEVTWVKYYGKKWVDKSYNISRRVPILGHRPLNTTRSIEDLIRLGAEDQSSLVKKIAANGLVKYAGSVSDISKLMTLFENNQSPSIKSCMDYLSRQVMQISSSRNP